MQRCSVEFSQEKPSYYTVQTAIKFHARANGRPVVCFLQVATLSEQYADFEEGRAIETFSRHRLEIESIAAAMIANGYVNSDGDLFIHSREFALFRENSRRAFAEPSAVRRH